MPKGDNQSFTHNPVYVPRVDSNRRPIYERGVDYNTGNPYPEYLDDIFFRFSYHRLSTMGSPNETSADKLAVLAKEENKSLLMALKHADYSYPNFLHILVINECKEPLQDRLNALQTYLPMLIGKSSIICDILRNSKKPASGVLRDFASNVEFNKTVKSVSDLQSSGDHANKKMKTESGAVETTPITPTVKEKVLPLLRKAISNVVDAKELGIETWQLAFKPGPKLTMAERLVYTIQADASRTARARMQNANSSSSLPVTEQSGKIHSLVNSSMGGVGK